MQRLLPPYLFVISVTGMVLLWLLLPLGIAISWPVTLVGWPILVVGLAIPTWGAIRFGRVRTNLNTFGDPRRFVTDGLFRFTRNPMYLGLVIALLGLAIALGAFSPFVGPVVFFVAGDRWYIPFEERRMLEAFGDGYRDYVQTTRRWL